MKTFFYTIILAFLGLQLSFAQVGIGTTTPDPNAALDVESTTQGVLIPRMLKAQRELIGGGSPAAGMLVYQTDDVAGFYFYNGTAWVSLTTVKPSGLETVDEGNGNGIVKVGRNPANYGNVGLDAVDFSFSDALSTTYGATGDYSTAMGNLTTASGNYSTAMGFYTEASGDYSTAMGRSTTASGFISTAMGFNTEASGSYSTAMGNLTTASGNYSTAIGVETEALGGVSAAMGFQTEASGNYSTSMGFRTRNTTFANLAIGRYNDGFGNPTSWVSTDPVFEIGIGTSDFNRINAMTVLKNGNVGIGKTNPLQALDVVGSTAITDNLQVDNTTLFVNSVTNRVGIGTPIPLQALSVVGNAEVTGNLGIGTASPIAKLDVNGNAFVNGNVGVVGNAEVTGNLGIGTASPIAKLDVNGNAYVNGNVGIGATNPSQALDVVGNAEINGAAIVTNNLQVDNTTLFVNASNNRVGIGTTSPSQALDVVGNAEVTGSLGIGTGTPIEKLDVNGNIFANGSVYGKRAAFTGSSTSTRDLSTITDGDLTLSFVQLVDPLNNLDNSLFTAPRTGMYFFSTSVAFENGDGLDDTMWMGFSVEFAAPFTEIVINPRGLTSPGVEQTYSHSAVLILSAGQRVSVQIRNISTTTPVLVQDRTFTGFYLGDL